MWIGISFQAAGSEVPKERASGRVRPRAEELELLQPNEAVNIQRLR